MTPALRPTVPASCRSGPPTALLVAAVLLSLTACGPTGGIHEITETRLRPENRSANGVAATSAQRFGDQSAAAGHSGGGGGGAVNPDSLSYEYKLPAGWRELQPAQFRPVNLGIDGRPGVDCYLTVLPGKGGGVLANLNRWRGQVGLGAISAADVADLPRGSMMGKQAVYCRFDGPEGKSLAGMVVELPMAAIFMKLLGPADDVAAEIPRFEEFCASLRIGFGGGARTGGGSDDHAGHGGFDPSRLAWTAPDGWQDAGAKQMRVVTFVPEGRPELQCYVSVLSGAAGGLMANVNRWRDQLGLPAASRTEIEGLPTLDVLGKPSPYVELVDPEGGSGMLALTCELGSHTVFVKMIGSAADVEAERGNFTSFCQSLRQ